MGRAMQAMQAEAECGGGVTNIENDMANTEKNMSKEDRIKAVEAGHALGWSFTPLRGKVPTSPRWQAAPRETLDEALAWARDGNIGMRTGAASGVFVVERDSGSESPPFDLSPTVRVLTPSGGEHYYFQDPGGLGNSASKIATHWDAHGDGRQVVAPGSIHPNGGEYRWAPGCSPDDLPLAVLPKRIADMLAR